LADWIERTKAPNKLFVLDSDHAWESLRPPYDDHHLDDIVTQRDVYSWDEWKAGLTDYTAEAKSRIKPGERCNDWLVVDMADAMWTVSQNDYFGKAYGTDIEDYMIQARVAGTNVGGEFGVNWTVINKMHGSINDRVKQWPGHVLACTPAAELRHPDKQGRGGDPEALIALFSRVGFKPQGQKNLPYEYATIIFTQQLPGDNGWVITTVKERESPEQPRERLAGQKVLDFPSSYLIPVAKWKP
jgi:hypothetical protein